eukprot:358375-Chlamydomonas_euryale.AAC.19
MTVRARLKELPEQRIAPLSRGVFACAAERTQLDKSAETQRRRRHGCRCARLQPKQSRPRGAPARADLKLPLLSLQASRAYGCHTSDAQADRRPRPPACHVQLDRPLGRERLMAAHVCCARWLRKTLHSCFLKRVRLRRRHSHITTVAAQDT